MQHFKRYCKTLQLNADPELVKEYKRLHAAGNAWPEVTQGMKDVGIVDMEIYIAGTTLFMIMDTEENFDHEKAMARLADLPRQAEWEESVSRFQKTSMSSSAAEKWRLIERIYKMDQREEEQADKGYIQRTPRFKV
jgi:L-rhamnose mutarotase